MDSGARAQLLNVILQKVKSEGHSCVEIKSEQGNTFILCFLCDERFGDEKSLRVHLSCYLHMLKQGNMNLNVHKSNAWPFNDNLFFFHDAHEKLKRLQQLDGTFPGSSLGDVSDRRAVKPDALKKVTSDSGIAKIAARFCEDDGVSNILRIWCEWLGIFDQSLKGTAEHEFSVLTFPYKSNMGRSEILVDMLRYTKENKGDSSEEESQSNGGDSSGEDSQSNGGDPSQSKGGDSSGEDSQSNGSEDSQEEYFPVSRMKEIMENALTFNCGICNMVMIPHKDVGALLNTKTGRLVCFDRNSTGTFHVYHISCLIQWILVCEVVTLEEERKMANDNSGKRQKVEDKQIYSVFCPGCEGIGVTTDEDGTRHVTPKCREISELILKIFGGEREWKNTPELLENSSIGLGFPREGKFLHEKVSSLKVLRFYRGC